MVVADDHPIYRESLSRALSLSGRVRIIDECANGVEALEAVRARRPAVALVDFRMPLLDGMEIVRAVKRERLPTQVLLISGSVSGEVAGAASHEGAAGFLSKDVPRAEIVAAVEAVDRGDTVFPAGARPADSPTAVPPGGALSDRELQIVDAFARGLSIPLVAQELSIANSTAKTHTRRLYGKLGVGDRAAAVAEAMRRGFLT
ncbi:response regulator transcription factor [Streptomyces sp. TRM72054]|uniref:response regulator transcription factor n=1 Tax=Streptomyces sp. TRM72054 TaxID=2870562 RepID=UPI0027E0D26C|nr:response regulator transcription factor [Streptomyces sp. TRM72054]